MLRMQNRSTHAVSDLFCAQLGLTPLIREVFNVATRSKIDKLTSDFRLSSIADVHAQTQSFIDEIQQIRCKSRKFTGSDNGRLKVLAEAIRVAVKDLPIRANSSEDPLYWREKFFELERQTTDIKV